MVQRLAAGLAGARCHHSWTCPWFFGACVGDELGSMFQASVFGSVNKFATSLLDKLVSAWVDDMKELTSLINGWIPEGWQVSKDKVLEVPGMSDLLLKNRHYKSLSAGTTMLEEMWKHIPKITQDGCGSIVEMQLPNDARDVGVAGSDTAVTTWAIWLLAHVILGKPSPVVRKQEAEELLKEATYVGCIGVILEQRAALFIAGKPPSDVAQEFAA